MKSSRRKSLGNPLYWGGSIEYGVLTVRLARFSLQLKMPWNEPLFSERNGYYRFRVGFRGWRLIYRNDTKWRYD